MLNEALRLIRVFHDLNQKELAERLETSNSYISELESGKKKPSLEILERYSGIFDIPLSSIFFFSENIDRSKKSEVAREYIAKKILTILQWISEKDDLGYAE